MERIGYKAFDKGLIDKYGNKRELNHIYRIEGPIMWYSTKGGNGFHFCTYLEDCLSYFNGFDGDIDITIVKGSGTMVRCDDEYRGNYEMYASRNIEILRILTRKEIIDYFLERKHIPWVIRKFIYGYPLTTQEQSLFMDDKTAKNLINKVYNNQKVYVKTIKK